MGEGELNLHPPEHPRFPSDAGALRDPHRTPTAHERQIADVFMRYKQVPDFDSLPAPTVEELAAAEQQLEAIAAEPVDPVRDQDERVLEVLNLISDFPQVFGKVGYFLAAEIMNAAKNNIDTSEFRRSFYEQYKPMIPEVRDYLRRSANLRRRALAVKYAPTNVPQGQWASQERRAAAKEQMELVQGLADHYVMEKFWRTLEIVCSYPDFFRRSSINGSRNERELIRRGRRTSPRPVKISPTTKRSFTPRSSFGKWLILPSTFCDGSAANGAKNRELLNLSQKQSGSLDFQVFAIFRDIARLGTYYAQNLTGTIGANERGIILFAREVFRSPSVAF